MKQVVQNFKTGELKVKEVPMPQLSEGMVLVETRCSLISSGTERGTVNVAKANLLDKARQRPDLVKQVFENYRKEGFKATLDKVQSKLDAPKALGYSCSGIVIASLDKGNRYKPGDRVACAGQDYASHSEVVSVPQNLVAGIPDSVSFEEAAFTTMGAIALQGVRQANPKLGENVCVIGLGLLGQITVQLLQASGCRVYSIDLSPKQVEIAKDFSDRSNVRTDENLVKDAMSFTNQLGFDQVIITASTSSNDPIELAAEISRKKGTVVIVGAVGMDIPRDPHFYRKELELKMSTSYGPGRYDSKYEELGIDYPAGYVRWTEQRNMEAFLQTISKKQVSLSPLITHRMEIDDADKAYDLVTGKSDEFNLGIVINYPQRVEKFEKTHRIKLFSPQQVNVGFIGAGSFAQSYLIPTLSNSKKVSLHTVITGRGINADSIAGKFGFAEVSSEAEELFSKEIINTIFIASRHDSHGKYVEDALLNEKNVFVEKPLALSVEELENIQKAYNRGKNPRLLVGYNRRFSQAAKLAKETFSTLNDPILINYRVNAGEIEADSWIQQPEIGGGRIVGEICHFVDLFQYLTGSEPVSVFAESLPGYGDIKRNDDNITILIRFANGSVGNITYASNGDKSMPKERIEIFSGNKSVVIDDFKAVSIFSGGKNRIIKVTGKGHKEEVNSFIDCIVSGKESPISFDSLLMTSLLTFKIQDSLKTGLVQVL